MLLQFFSNRCDSKHRADRVCERVDNRPHFDGGQHGFPWSGVSAGVVEEQLLLARVQKPTHPYNLQSAPQVLQHHAHRAGKSAK